MTNGRIKANTRSSQLEEDLRSLVSAPASGDSHLIAMRDIMSQMRSATAVSGRIVYLSYPANNTD